MRLARLGPAARTDADLAILRFHGSARSAAARRVQSAPTNSRRPCRGTTKRRSRASSPTKAQRCPKQPGYTAWPGAPSVSALTGRPWRTCVAASSGRAGTFEVRARPAPDRRDRAARALPVPPAERDRSGDRGRLRNAGRVRPAPRRASTAEAAAHSDGSFIGRSHRPRTSSRCALSRPSCAMHG